MDALKEVIPQPRTELQFQNGYQLAVAVVLSAQCTDERVNRTTPVFFQHYPAPESLAQARQEDVAAIIKSVTYPNNKAKHLIAMAQQVVAQHGGQMPQERDELEKLPGIGRKTANVLAAELYDKPHIAVDTHVFRVTHRLGLIQAKNTRQAEEQLNELIPPQRRPEAHHLFILHGRHTCKARKPACGECSIQAYCDYYQGRLPTDPAKPAVQ
jgi:endonuclease-3